MRRTGAIVVLAALGLGACGGDAAAPGPPPPPPPPGPAPPGSWAPRAPMPEARTENSAAALGGLVYVAGGFASRSGDLASPAELLAYDPVRDAWSVVGELPLPVNHAGLAAAGGRLFVVGGFAEATFQATNALQIFDPGTGEFQAGPPLPTARGALAVAVVDGRIHAIAGVDAAGRDVRTHEVFDPATGSWTARAALPTARDHHGAAVIGGRIYVPAGRVGNANVAVLEVYDPATDAWSAGPPVPTARSGIGVAALEGKLYVFGGEDLQGGGTFDEAERFDPASGDWEAAAPMLTSRHGLGAATLDGAIYVVGGGPGAGLTFSAENERFTPD